MGYVFNEDVGYVMMDVIIGNMKCIYLLYLL